MHVSIKGNLNLESRQDSNHYDSKQTQAGAGFSVAIYGSGSSASANYSQNKAKVNYAQVEEQTGFHVGKGGMDVKVAGNTHLAGSVIDSEADQDKNHFKTKSLTHTDIENRSEVEVKSVSAGLSTDMAQNAKNAMAAAASALGNKHESATSQTQSAIGSNIQIDTETPENLTALSRDTQNANHKVKAFDHNEVKEQQEAAQVAGELFAKVTGDLAKKFEFEDGSKEKIAMHALAGALAAKMSDGNVATGVAAGAGSEWLNTYVTDYLNEQAKDLKLDDGQKEKLKQAAQQMTALVIGAAAGAVSGGTSETMKQGALTSYNAETYNRQLHVDEIKWIKENAKRFAQEESERLGHQVTEQEAMERLITQAAQEVDYAWFKKIGETDGQAQSFLRGATVQGDVPPYDNRGTFINSDGKRQSMFTVMDKDEYYSTGKYSNALAQFDKANGHVVTNTLQPKVKYNLYTKSLSDGADAALKGTLHAFDHPEDVLKPISFGIANCLKEDMCISSGKEMLSDSGKAVWQSGKDILGAGYHLDDVNYLYGKNMVNEVDAIAAVRGSTALLELAPTVSVAGKTMKWIGGKWVRSPDVDYSRDNANLGINNKGFNISLNENISVKPAGTISNIDSVNKLIKGELPGVSTNNRVGVPREMAPTSTPNETAKDFIKRYTESLGEELPKPIITGKNKDLEKYELNNGTVIMLRTSGTASSKTSSSTATVDINNPELRHQNGGIQLKLKFPLKSEVK